MDQIAEFISETAGKFPDDRLTYQKGVPTFHPENAEEAASFISLAGAVGQKLFVTGFGNNIDPTGAEFEKLVTLRHDRLNDLLEINESNLSILVGSGFPLREINYKLEDHGLFFPLSNLPYVGSVGGAIAIGLSARLDKKHWGQKTVGDRSVAPEIEMSRYVLNLEVATPTGKVQSFGAGSGSSPGGENYARIFSPSWGLFGFIASAKLRVLPLEARDEYENLTIKPINHANFLANLERDPESDPATRIESSAATSYLAQIREKFDPSGLFPVVRGKL